MQIQENSVYTKVVLSIIACCLIILVWDKLSFIPHAHANIEAGKDQNAFKYGMVPINEDGSINVRLVGEDVMDVKIIAIESSATWDPILVRNR